MLNKRMYCGLCSTPIISAVILWQLFSISEGKSGDLKDPSEIFLKHHTAVVTVTNIANGNEGTGFSIDPKEYLVKETGKKSKFVITASHIVHGVDRVILGIYQNEKDSDGNWKYEICKAEIYGLDIVRDVALLEIACDNCNSCKRLGALQTRLSTVNDEETILVIGGSPERGHHSFIDGRLSSTNFTFSLASQIYKRPDKVTLATTFVSRVHGLTGSFGNSGSAVMDKSGKVIGMILAINVDRNICVTMEEISKAYEQILDTSTPRFVACTAHESALLGRTHWADRSGKSINEMNALATAMDAQYFAVAHDGLKAHAFTFHVLWWEILPENDYIKEDASQCRCEITSFTDGKRLERTEDGKVMCGCSENACRRNSYYQRRFGEDNDRRWAVYKIKRNSDKNRQYIPSEESLHVIKDIAREIDYWKQKVKSCSKEKEKLVLSKKHIKQKADILTTENEKLKFYITIGIAMTACVVPSFIICICCINVKHEREHKRLKNSQHLLKEELNKTTTERDRLRERQHLLQEELNETTTERDRLRERLSQQEELQNPTNAPTQESKELDEDDDGQLC